jgi:hypothetical protein
MSPTDVPATSPSQVSGGVVVPTLRRNDPVGVRQPIHARSMTAPAPSSRTDVPTTSPSQVSRGVGGAMVASTGRVALGHPIDERHVPVTSPAGVITMSPSQVSRGVGRTTFGCNRREAAGGPIDERHTTGLRPMSPTEVTAASPSHLSEGAASSVGHHRREEQGQRSHTRCSRTGRRERADGAGDEYASLGLVARRFSGAVVARIERVVDGCPVSERTRRCATMAVTATGRVVRPVGGAMHAGGGGRPGRGSHTCIVDAVTSPVTSRGSGGSTRQPPSVRPPSPCRDATSTRAPLPGGGV